MSNETITPHQHETEHTENRDPMYVPDFVPLPRAPVTASPVPWLTSIHATPGRGGFGDASYPGNCSGKLIRDLLAYYQPGSVFDPMTGSGTCRDVAAHLGIPCESRDLRSGFDAADASCFEELGEFDFIWLHPPYWNMIRYNQDTRCLSSASTLADFLQGLERVVENCRAVLAPGGVLAILMGGLTRGDRCIELPFHTFNVLAAQGFRLAAPEIIRFSHGAGSSRKRYRTSFIPRLHEVCLIAKL